MTVQTTNRQSSRYLIAATIATAAVAATLLVYLPAIDGGFYFDDAISFVDRPALHWDTLSIDGVREVATMAHHRLRLVPNLSLAVNHAIGGLDPRGYHVFNLIVHLLVGASLMWVCLEYDRGSSRNGTKTGGSLAAASAVATLFLLHPLNTQAVSYVVQRMTSLAALFVLLAFGCYLAARRTTLSRRRRVALFTAAAVAWTLGVLSKEITLALPAVIVVFELVFYRDSWKMRLTSSWSSGVGRRKIAAVILLATLGVSVIGWGFVPWHVLSSFEPLHSRDFSWPQRVLTQPRAQLFYLSLLLYPAPSRLNLDHDFAVSRSPVDPPTTIVAVAVTGIALLGAIQLTRRRPRWGFPLLAYLIFHTIESGPVNLELVFEHRMYLPMTALALFLYVVITDSPARIRKAISTLVPIAAIGLGVSTYQRNLVWADNIALHIDAAAKSPGKFRPQYNLGTELGKAGRYDESRQALLRALELDPEHSQTHNQLGTICFIRGDHHGALEYYQAAVDLDPNNAEAIYNLALVSETLGDLETALDQYRSFVTAAQGYPFLATTVRDVQAYLPSLAAQVNSHRSAEEIPSVSSHGISMAESTERAE